LKKNRHTDFRAWVLSFLLVFAFVTKELHHIFDHHHEEVKICHVNHGEQHLHDADYISDECSLCDFTFSIYDFSLQTYSLPISIDISIKLDFTYQSYILSKKTFFKQLRAPPVVV
jgi:hypothetical protein